MILYCLFNSLWLNADVPLRGAGTAMLQQPLHKGNIESITVDVFLLDGKAKIGAQTFENIVGVGGSQFLAEKVLNIMLDVKGIDFLHFCDAMMLLCVDQEIQGIVVISLE